jgi:UDP-N-acetylmuramate dehydrogenase
LINNISSLKQYLSEIKIKYFQDQNLSGYTTIGVGGKASLVAIAESSLQLEQVVISSVQSNVPYLVIGKGSNLIISDEGYDGLIIVNESKDWSLVRPDEEKISPLVMQPDHTITATSNTTVNKSIFLHDNRKVFVLADSGVQVRNLTNALYRYGITGLQWYAGIPATIGGAIYMNMHGGSYFFGELVNRVFLLSGVEKKVVGKSYFDFGYDYSILHKSKEIILRAELILPMGDVNKAKEEGKSWAKQKSIQPQRSAGCIFHNLTEEQRIQLNLPTASIGYLVDKILNLRGTRIGDAIISNNHAAFIENMGKATAKDVYELIQLVKNRAKEELQINLQLEVELIGNFDS